MGNGPTTSGGIGQLVGDLLAARNARDTERIGAFYGPRYEGVDVGEAKPRRRPQGIPRFVGRYVQAFADLGFVEEDVVVRGDRAALVWTDHGTTHVEADAHPPTGRKIAVRGILVLTVEHGKGTRGLYVWDAAGLLRAIGLLPEL